VVLALAITEHYIPIWECVKWDFFWRPQKAKSELDPLYVSITVRKELLPNTEGGEDEVQDIVAGGLARERVQVTKPVV
jgi:hypothetical protein